MYRFSKYSHEGSGFRSTNSLRPLGSRVTKPRSSISTHTPWLFLPPRPKRCLNDLTEGGMPSNTTIRRSPMSIPSSNALVETTPDSSPSQGNAGSLGDRLPRSRRDTAAPCRETQFRKAHRPLSHRPLFRCPRLGQLTNRGQRRQRVARPSFVNRRRRGNGPYRRLPAPKSGSHKH